MMIQTLKQSSLRLLNGTGVSRCVAGTPWRRNRLLILCYHGVSQDDEHLWDSDLYVSAAHLQRRLELLRQNRCAVLPLGEGLSRLYSGTLPSRAVVLTFDDGYYDFLPVVQPLLRAHDYPATVYLTTHRVEHPLPNVDLFVSYALWLARDRQLDARGILNLDHVYELATAADRQQVVRSLAAARTSTPEWKMDEAARQIVDRLGLNYDAMLERRLMTLLRPAEVSQLAREGVDFQLHTHLHRTPEDPEEFVRDVIVNRERIESMTGIRAEHLCYPSSNFRAAYPPVLRQHGIVSATTCDPDIATRSSDPMRLPRFVDTGTVSEAVFVGWITGAAACLPRRTRRALEQPFDEPPLPLDCQAPAVVGAEGPAVGRL